VKNSHGSSCRSGCRRKIIHDDEPAIGHEAITEFAKSFRTALPDLLLEFNGLEFVNGLVNYHWTFKGTSTSPCGTGNAVNFSGFESRILDKSGLIVESLGQFDAIDYDSQLTGRR
jgi:hypothetical protein